MKRKTLTTAVMAGLTGLAGLASVARANTLEELNLPASFTYEDNCATVYEAGFEKKFCWEEQTPEQKTPMMTYSLGNGCIKKYYSSTDKRTICSRLEDLQIPEQHYK